MDVIAEIYKEADAFPWSTEPEVARLLAAVARMTNRKCVLELGTFKGATAATLAEVCMNGVTTVDKDDLRSPLFKEHYCRDKCIFIQEDSRKFRNPHLYDFIFFDTAHTEEQLNDEVLNVQSMWTRDVILAFHDSMLFPGVRKFIASIDHLTYQLTLPTPRGCGLTLATLK